MNYWVDIATQCMIFVGFAVSLNLLVGVAGQFSVAHATFGGIGGYVGALLSIELGFPFWAAIIVGVAAAVLLGVIVSLPALRLGAEHLILLTLAVASVAVVIAENIPGLGGENGLVGISPPEFLGIEINTPERFFFVAAFGAWITYHISHRLSASPYGRVLRSIRDDETVPRSLAKKVYQMKVSVFAVTAGLAGLAGTLLAFYFLFVSPTEYGFTETTNMFAMIIVGGLGNLAGSVVGAILIVAITPILQKLIVLQPQQTALVTPLLFGCLVVAIMLFRPEGIVRERVVPRVAGGIRTGRLLRRRSGDAGTVSLGGPVIAVKENVVVGEVTNNGSGASSILVQVEREATSDSTLPVEGVGEGSLTVEARGLSKRFGGLQAVDRVSVSLYRGRVTAIIGPNGAGKTTLFNLLTGSIRPDAGEILVDRGGDDIRSSLGMARSFQDVRLIPSLSSLDNVALAVQNQCGERMRSLFGSPRKWRSEEARVGQIAMEALKFTGSEDIADVPAYNLSFGEQKLVALARVFATGAHTYLLDEPTSGVAPDDVDRILALVDQMRRHGKAICIVEHSLHVLQKIADTALFVDTGRVVATGTIAELLDQHELVESYFGV